MLCCDGHGLTLHSVMQPCCCREWVQSHRCGVAVWGVWLCAYPFVFCVLGSQIWVCVFVRCRRRLHRSCTWCCPVRRCWVRRRPTAPSGRTRSTVSARSSSAARCTGSRPTTWAGFRPPCTTITGCTLRGWLGNRGPVSDAVAPHLRRFFDGFSWTGGCSGVLAGLGSCVGPAFGGWPCVLPNPDTQLLARLYGAVACRVPGVCGGRYAALRHASCAQ